jgi:hypothetical protein
MRSTRRHQQETRHAVLLAFLIRWLASVILRRQNKSAAAGEPSRRDEHLNGAWRAASCAFYALMRESPAHLRESTNEGDTTQRVSEQPSARGHHVQPVSEQSKRGFHG